MPRPLRLVTVLLAGALAALGATAPATASAPAPAAPAAPAPAAVARVSNTVDARCSFLTYRQPSDWYLPAGEPRGLVWLQHGFSRSTFHKWQASYGGMDTSALRRLRELEDENRRLKQMYADLSLDHQVLKEVLEKSVNGSAAAGGGAGGARDAWVQ